MSGRQVSSCCRCAEPMSQQLINDYLAELDVLKKVSGRTNESIVREAPHTHQPEGIR